MTTKQTSLKKALLDHYARIPAASKPKRKVHGFLALAEDELRRGNPPKPAKRKVQPFLGKPFTEFSVDAIAPAKRKVRRPKASVFGTGGCELEAEHCDCLCIERIGVIGSEEAKRLIKWLENWVAWREQEKNK